eukprot:CAMPEP_0184329158 /NCGR_PEP_ID=MMETSP1049-20130417/144000_1 /TAXON_ID=77928 /ORGANISM="Proteomonas sulcata, Strain CCMP704" /LENGTH=435 /DNA_ID=CAMNT_0026651505 /DNA_START=141 /DNA_END=1448 /DNA_ORIENTATION=+
MPDDVFFGDEDVLVKRCLSLGSEQNWSEVSAASTVEETPMDGDNAEHLPLREVQVHTPARCSSADGWETSGLGARPSARQPERLRRWQKDHSFVDRSQGARSEAQTWGSQEARSLRPWDAEDDEWSQKSWHQGPYRISSTHSSQRSRVSSGSERSLVSEAETTQSSSPERHVISFSSTRRMSGQDWLQLTFHLSKTSSVKLPDEEVHHDGDVSSIEGARTKSDPGMSCFNRIRSSCSPAPRLSMGSPLPRDIPSGEGSEAGISTAEVAHVTEGAPSRRSMSSRSPDRIPTAEVAYVTEGSPSRRSMSSRSPDRRPTSPNWAGKARRPSPDLRRSILNNRGRGSSRPSSIVGNEDSGATETFHYLGSRTSSLQSSGSFASQKSNVSDSKAGADSHPSRQSVLSMTNWCLTDIVMVALPMVFLLLVISCVPHTDRKV